jgi:antitoxin component YwqK of YwqJK toxin-antitoxin module
VAYQGGQPEGLYRAFYPDGRRAQEGWFVNGLREGEWVFFTPDGQRDSRSGYYVAGAQRIP